MSAKDLLRSNKTTIELILSENRKLILRKCHENELITDREYSNLKIINQASNEDHVIELMDKIMGKGEERCKEFVDLLQNDAELKETFPNLKDILLKGTTTLPKPTQETATTAKIDDVEQQNRKRKQEMDPSDGVTPNKDPKQDVDEPYPLESTPTGLCFIINNVDFNNNKPRRGSDEDAEKLAKTFTSVGFRVLMCKDQTKDQMDRVLKCVSARDVSKLEDFNVKEWSVDTFTDVQKEPAHGDAFVCCILSHGNTGTVYGTDEEELSIKDIKQMFKASERSPLTNKPKLFLIQACQGGKAQRGVALTNVESDDLPCRSIPEEADFLFGMSTVEEYVSYRQKTGSWYIQSVCKQMEKGCPSGVDMCTILHRVNNDVSELEGQWGQKQMPEIRSTLRKKLVFSTHSN